MMSRHLLMSAVLMLSVSSMANAAEVIYGAAGSPTNRTDGGQVVGFSFTAYGSTLNSLGFFDFGQNGLAASYQVGLWDSSQNLVATTTVYPTSPLIGDFRYGPISPVTLGSPGNPEVFTIGALLPTTMLDVWWSEVFVLLGAGYTGAATGQYLNPSLTLAYPTSFDGGGTNYYVVNGSETVVPEPASLGVLGMGTLLLLRRKVK
jgi:hypothetical protein